MPVEPSLKRAIAFVDGQNLFHGVKSAFGYTFPNYDIAKLSDAVCRRKSWNLCEARFYTGVPSQADAPVWNRFWSNKLAAMKRAGIHSYHRPLVYRLKSVNIPGVGVNSIRVGEEKGIDVRLALDVLDAVYEDRLDVAVIFSEDQDLSELVTLIHKVSRSQNRWIKIASAYPIDPARPRQRGIDRSDWCPFDKAFYDSCIDPVDYRP